MGGGGWKSDQEREREEGMPKPGKLVHAIRCGFLGGIEDAGGLNGCSKSIWDGTTSGKPWTIMGVSAANHKGVRIARIQETKLTGTLGTNGEVQQTSSAHEVGRWRRRTRCHLAW